MNESTGDYRMYRDLAPWWPLISPPEDYEEEATELAALLSTATGPVREVLELGSGGGHNASFLKDRFTMTLVDLSPEMLAVSRRLNPECEHLHGDMRTVRLDRIFDAVLVHDAVDYLTSADELGDAAATAFAHCRPGGVAVFLPDDTTETFTERTDCGGVDAPDGRGVRYLEWNWDPDPGDAWVVTEFSFLLRAADGSVEAVHETHRTGLFPTARWLTTLTDAGFDASAAPERTSEDRPPRTVFVARRPPS